ncbi:hypothetical protein Tco_0286991 [Tanacetum coccineum]
MSCVMINCNDKKLKDRDVAKLRKVVGGRPYGETKAAWKGPIMIYICFSHISSQNRRDLPRDIPLDSVVVLRYEKRSKSKNKGKVPTEMELVLEQTQQAGNPVKEIALGISYSGSQAVFILINEEPWYSRRLVQLIPDES